MHTGLDHGNGLRLCNNLVSIHLNLLLNEGNVFGFVVGSKTFLLCGCSSACLISNAVLKVKSGLKYF